MHKFPSIDSFYQVARYLDKSGQLPRSVVTYRGTVKLHGTNAGVRCTPSELIPQSRTKERNDSFGFATFVSKHEKSIRKIEDSVRRELSIDPEFDIVLFGEWVGPGIQKGVAVNSLPERQWVLFSVHAEVEKGQPLVPVPALDAIVTSPGLIHSILAVPSYTLRVDFSRSESRASFMEKVMSITANVEDCCPWGENFGIRGTGEGVVWTPMWEHFGNPVLPFKSKGEKHKMVAPRKKGPQMSPEKLESVDAFVKYAVSKARLAQGIFFLKEEGHPLDVTSTGTFLKWLANDIQKECTLDLEESGLTYKDVNKKVMTLGRDFFKSQLDSF